MSISVVSGQLCFSSCDVAKAESGKNPHQQPRQFENDPAAKSGKSDGTSGDQLAVTFGGSLKDQIAAVSATSVSTAPKTNLVRPSLNLLA